MSPGSHSSPRFQLPPAFHKSIHNLSSADLLFVIGTSLTVYPFAGLTQLVRKSCPRVLINLDSVGDIGSRIDDVVLLGQCDKTIEDLCRLLGWGEELEKLWVETANTLDPEELTVDPPASSLDEEVKKLTSEVEETLKISEKLKEEVQKLAEASDPQKSPEDSVGKASSRPPSEPRGNVKARPDLKSRRSF